MNKIEIEIPVGKEVDWEASAKQKQIVLKDQQLTYEDVCNKLFEKSVAYFTDSNGLIHTFSPKQYQPLVKSPNNALTRHQLECILAKNKLANVARYLNGDWEYSIYDEGYVIGNNKTKGICYVTKVSISTELSNVLFKNYELAKKAIEILGEKTIKLALTPLY